MGLSPAAFFRNLRLHYAAFLLRETELPVLEIAVDSGFVDGMHLTREFKRQFAETPRHYRSRHRAAVTAGRKGLTALPDRQPAVPNNHTF